MSYLALEGYHAFVTGARGGIGSAIVSQLLGTAQVQLYNREIED
jgi:NAD(P)-dependent dehydrogenase (short-subunit alcohol dehydrogenase family)